MENKLLTIFIPTYNRAHLIGETLDSFIEQVSEFCIPIVISDNCSTDGTLQVIEKYKKKYPYIKYSRNNENLGFDGNVVKMAGLVKTKYCWLFGDDDIINKGAIVTVLDNLKKDFDLIVVNATLNSVDLSKEISRSHLSINKDILYNGNEIDKAFVDLAAYSSFIGGLIVKKELWESIDYNKYLKSGFVHVGISFEYLSNSSNVYYISHPFVAIRLGNSGWSKNSFEIWYVLWVKAINKIPNYTDDVKHKVYVDINEISLKGYIIERARGSFRKDVYKRFFKNNNLISMKKKFFLLILLLVPILFLKFFWRLYLMYKKPSSYEYQLYELNCSSASETNYL